MDTRSLKFKVSSQIHDPTLLGFYLQGLNCAAVNKTVFSSFHHLRITEKIRINSRLKDD